MRKQAFWGLVLLFGMSVTGRAQAQSFTESAASHFSLQQQPADKKPLEAQRNATLMGEITIATTTGSYPVLIDEVSAGKTAVEGRKLTTAEGTHRFVVEFPDGRIWERQISVAANQSGCTIVLNDDKNSPKIMETFINCLPPSMPAAQSAASESMRPPTVAGFPQAGTRCTRLTRPARCPKWFLRWLLGCTR